MAHHHLKLLFIFALCLAIETSWAARPSSSESAKAYWEEHLPNTPMPSILQSMLPISSRYDFKGAKDKFNDKATFAIYSWYDYEHETPEKSLKEDLLTTIFIRPQDLKAGHNVDIKFMGPSKLGPPFMSRDFVDKFPSLPFSSARMARILTAFAIDPKSPLAHSMRSTLRRCEDQKREAHQCVPSLESMVDFVESQLGNKVTPLSLRVTPEMDTKKRYSIVNVKKLAIENEAVSCHKASFPYGVFYCHRLTHAELYHVELLHSNNNQQGSIRVDTALASCHHDTATWHPRYAGFKVLNIEHGQPLCHFLHADNVVFLPPHHHHHQLIKSVEESL